MQSLPDIGFVRLEQIIGKKNSNPPILGVIPMSRSLWFEGMRDGIFPEPVKITPKINAWKVEEIRALIERLNNGESG